MRKITVIIICAVVLLLCIKNISFGENYKYQISSQIQYNIFNIKTEKYTAKLSSGIREEDFEYDGKSSSKLEYGLIEVSIKGFTDYAKEIDIVINLDKQNTVYTLEKNPFNNSFVCDIGKTIKDNNIIKVQIPLIDEAFYELECISSMWPTNYKHALNVGFNEFRSFIKQSSSCEIYLTIVDGDANDNNYFWLFRVQTIQLKTKILVIDIKTGEIVLKS